MFPYPSGVGLHVGHPEGYTATDIMARAWRIFLQLFRRGLAYQATVPVNWCPALGTVLANEEVVDGKSERGGHPVYRTPLRQWMLKITAYADRLAEDLALGDWPEGTLTAQR